MNETHASFVPIETATETASLTPLPVPAAGLEPASGMAQSGKRGDPNGNRTRAAAVKGRCPNR